MWYNLLKYLFGVKNMIFDSIENAKLYYGLHEGIAKVLGQVKNTAPTTIPTAELK